MTELKGIARGRTVLEFDKIAAIASAYAYTDGGKHAVATCAPSADPVVVGRLLDETEEALELLTYKGAPPLSAAASVPDAVERSCKGAILTPLELLAIAALLLTAFLNVSPVYIILCVLVLGFSITYYKEGRWRR